VQQNAQQKWLVLLLERRNEMNVETGDIASLELLGKLFPETDKKNFVEIDTKNLGVKARQALARYGRTMVGLRSRCPCGSGKRFKSCCYKPKEVGV
jgi:uncharacterized protein YchJ